MRLYLLLRGVEGTAARVSRIALVFFVIFYGACETLQGIGVGALVDELNRLPEIEHRENRGRGRPSAVALDHPSCSASPGS